MQYAIQIVLIKDQSVTTKREELIVIFAEILLHGGQNSGQVKTIYIYIYI